MPNEPASTAMFSVMISSSFDMLQEHRQLLWDSLLANDLVPKELTLRPGSNPREVITQTFDLLGRCDACVAVIGQKYGSVPPHPKLNPQQVSLAELEFDEAQRLGRPVLFFMMGANHEVKLKEVESDTERAAKLAAFRHRVATTSVVARFDNIAEFTVAVERALSRLRKNLEADRAGRVASTREPSAPPLPQLPDGAWRAEFAYRAVLQHPARYELLETLDVASLREALYALGGEPPINPDDVLSRLRGASPGAEPNPLWAAWIETVHASKMQQS